MIVIQMVGLAQFDLGAFSSLLCGALAPFVVVLAGVLLKTVGLSSVDLVDQDDAMLEAPLDMGLLAISLMFVAPGASGSLLSTEARNSILVFGGILIVIFYIAGLGALKESRKIYATAFKQLNRTQQKAQERDFKPTGSDLTKWKLARRRMWKYYLVNCGVILGMMVPIVVGRFQDEAKHLSATQIRGSSGKID